jgi:hypothetical protein
MYVNTDKVGISGQFRLVLMSGKLLGRVFDSAPSLIFLSSFYRNNNPSSYDWYVHNGRILGLTLILTSKLKLILMTIFLEAFLWFIFEATRVFCIFLVKGKVLIGTT